jgi:hypothetical protein
MCEMLAQLKWHYAHPKVNGGCPGQSQISSLIY